MCSAESEEAPLYKVEDLVWMVNKRRRKGQCPKLQPKFVGPYSVKEVYPSHTYLLEQNGQTSVQNEKRLKLHTASNCLAEQAPTLSEPRRRPNMRGATRREEEAVPKGSVPNTMLDLLSSILPTIAPPRPVVDPIVDNLTDNNDNNDNNIIIVKKAKVNQ